MGPPSLGAIISLIVASSMIAGVCLGTVLLHLVQLSRRRRMARVAMVMGLSGEAINAMAASSIKEAADEDEAAMLGLKRSPSRLYKTREGRVSPVRPTPLPVLPPLFSRRGSFNPFANGGGSGNTTIPTRSHSHGSRRANAAWIDEEALHGPQVSRGGSGAGAGDGGEGGGSRRNRNRLVRSSWPVNMSPTLPRLEHDDQVEDDERRRADDDMILAVLGGGELPPVMGPRQLPDPPKPAMHHSMGGPQRSLSNVSLSRRNPSTDSTLSEILRNTERRIQEGTMTGVARRNRATRVSASSSPSKTATAGVESNTATLMHVDSLGRRTPSPTKSAGPVTTPQYARSTTLMHVDSLGRRTPSPTKSAGPVTTPQYARTNGREASQSSFVSDSDSIYGGIDEAVQDTRPVADARRHEVELQRERSMSRPRSMRSSASSALSTVYSEEEPVEGTVNTSASRPASRLEWQSWSFLPVPGQTLPNFSRPGDDPFCTEVRRSTASLVVASPSSIKSYKSPITVIPGLTLLQPAQRQVAKDSQDTTPTKNRCEPPHSRNASSSPTLGRLSLHEQAMPYFPKPHTPNAYANASQPPGLVRASSTSSSTYSQEASVASRASSPRHAGPPRHAPPTALSYAQEVTALRSRSSVFLDEYNVEAPTHGLRLSAALGSLPLVSAVAELRRMNSAATTADHRNYLAVGNTARWSTTTPTGHDRMTRRLSLVASGAREDSDSDGGEGHDSGKENREAPAPVLDAMPLKMPKVDFSRDLPALARLKAGSRASVESLGLYDQDGFLKSSPVRTGRR